jgi:hypothetical protein
VNGLLGLTGKKVGFFDGRRILEHDLGRDVRAWINSIIAGSGGTNNYPCGSIYRRDTRIEYHLCYRDTTIGTATNNRRLVLNLDSLQILPENRVNAAWERWSNGANYMVTLNNGDWYCAQTHESKSVVYKKHDTRNIDVNIYKGDTLTASSDYGWSLKTGTFIPSIRGITRWITLWLLAKMSKEAYGRVLIEKWPSVNRVETFNPASADQNVPRYGVARYGVDRYAPESPVRRKGKLSRVLKGNAVYIEFYQTTEDRSFEFISSELYGVLTESRFT